MTCKHDKVLVVICHKTTDDKIQTKQCFTSHVVANIAIYTKLCPKSYICLKVIMCTIAYFFSNDMLTKTNHVTVETR